MGDKKCLMPVAVAVGAVLALIAGLVGTSLKQLDSFEIGLKYDVIWKSLSSDADGEGLHVGTPGFVFIKFPSVFMTLEFEKMQCLNKDGVAIYLDVSYQYRARPKDLEHIIMQFKDIEGYKNVLKFAGKTATMEACSLFNTTQFQTERGKFQESVGKKLVEHYDLLSCDVSEIQVSNIQRPGAYETAIQAKESARENIKVAESERPRKETQATTKKREATTQADITIQKAESNARIITNKAEAEAEAILEEFSKELEVYEQVMNKLGFTKEGFLSYLGVRAIDSAKNPVYVGIQSPAKTSYV